MANRLPVELIEEILGYLRPCDRLAAAATCKTWYEGSLTKHLWRDVTVVVTTSIDDVAKIFKSTRKPIQHMKLKDINFTSNNAEMYEFWNHISPELVSLEIHQGFMTEANLLNLLLPCNSLRSLHFHDCRDTFITGKLFYNPLVLKHIKTAVPNLSELCLADNCSYLSDALVDRFVSLISELRYLSLAGTSLSCHPGIHKKFYPETNGKEGGCKSSELVLTFDCILDHVVHHSGTLQSLDLSSTPINDRSCSALSQVASLKLHRLMLRSCEISLAGITALCATQTTLVELDVSFCARITDSALAIICASVPALQTLSLQSCRSVTDLGIASLHQLHSLREVNLQGLERVTSAGVEQGLLSKVNTTLRRLNVSATRIAEDTLHHLAAKAPGLTHLDLTSCVKAVTDSSLQAVWKSLRRLRDLRLDWCVGLTDAGFLLDPTAIGDAAPDDCDADEKRDVESIANLAGLDLLSVSGCNKITDASLERAFLFRELRQLNLNACSSVTDDGLDALSRHNCGLETLILNYCSRVSDLGLSRAINRLRRLKRLELHGCVKLTDRTLTAIELVPLRHLSYLNVSHCKLMSLERADLLQMRMPNIREVSTAGLD